MPRKSSPPPASTQPPDVPRQRGRSGEGTASLLAQLSDEQRAKATLRANPASDAAHDTESRPGPDDDVT